jgi:hypothetical protein
MPPRRASHAAHRLRFGRRRPASGSHSANTETPEVRELLESLDDAVFEALNGSDTALEKTRELWPVVVLTLGPEQIEESREQYLRYAVELTRRFEFKEIRNPAIAVAGLEIIEMLTRG